MPMAGPAFGFEPEEGPFNSIPQPCAGCGATRYLQTGECAYCRRPSVTNMSRPERDASVTAPDDNETHDEGERHEHA